MSNESRFIPMNTSSIRNNFSEVVDTVLGKKRVMFQRYGKNKAALVTTDDADVISYLLAEDDYERILNLAREVREEKEEADQRQEVNTR